MLANGETQEGIDSQFVDACVEKVMLRLNEQFGDSVHITPLNAAVKCIHVSAICCFCYCQCLPWKVYKYLHIKDLELKLHIINQFLCMTKQEKLLTYDYLFFLFLTDQSVDLKWTHPDSYPNTVCYHSTTEHNFYYGVHHSLSFEVSVLLNHSFLSWSSEKCVLYMYHIEMSL